MAGPRRLTLWALCGLLAPVTHAQTTAGTAHPPPVAVSPAGEAADGRRVQAPVPVDAQAHAPAEAVIGELDAVRVVGQRPVDPFAFRNPVTVDDNTFRRAWREPPSLHEIGMQGGLVQLAVGYVLMQGAEAIARLPGWKTQIEAATARPPPLDEDQLTRAARLDENAGAEVAP